MRTSRWCSLPRAPITAAIFATAILAGAIPALPQEPTHEPPTDSSTPMRHHTADHRFDDAERWSKQFDAAERDAWQKPTEVLALMEVEPGMTVVDIGAGTGYFLEYLAAATGPEGSVLGLDIEPAMVEFMTERAQREGWTQVEARLVEPDDPGLPAGGVDRVLIVNTWHHISDRAAYATRLRASLTPQGRIYIVDLTLESPHGPPVEHRLSPQQVIHDLEQGGLAARLLDESLPEQYIVVGVSPHDAGH